MQRTHSDNRIFERAMQWIDAFKDGGGDRAAFFAWLAESPRHVEELQFALALTEEIAGLTPEQRAQIEALANDSGGSERTGNVVPLTPGASTDVERRRRGWARAGALAAGLGVIAVVGWLSLKTLGGESFSTQTGEQRALQLADGSTVHLNARSRLKVRFDDQIRQLELLEGEALFKVARDPSRPFRVVAGDSVIQAVGTQFNVHRRISGTVVSVIEGAVRVEELQSGKAPTTLLTAGEEIRILRDGRRAKFALANPANAIAWRQHRLVFQGDTLADIAAEFNRHNAVPQIRIEGDDAAARHFAGTFDADAPQALIEALAGDPALQIDATAKEIVIRLR